MISHPVSHRELADKAAAVGVTIARVQPRIGAEIGGIDLRTPPSDAVRDVLYAALVKYRVIFFRDQDITRDQHLAFGRAFGALEIHPTHRDTGHPEIMPIHSEPTEWNLAAQWHTDVSSRIEPPKAAILRGVKVPGLGGDTLWSCAASAYEGLDDGTKAKIEKLVAEHDFLKAYHQSGRKQRGTDPKAEEEMRRLHPAVQHSVVRLHPDTGERMLYVNANFTTRVIGLDPADSDALLKKLWAQFQRPEYQVRFTWRPGSLAFWDERATQHYGVPGFEGTDERIVERVTIVGDRPFGPSQARAA